MSLLLKALQQADRGSKLSLEPMVERPAETTPTPPASAKAAAALMFEKQANAEKRRMLVLLGVLVAVVLGMAVYFYLAIFMPWVFLPKPAAVSATPAPIVQVVPAAPPVLAAAPLPPAAAEAAAPRSAPSKPLAAATEAPKSERAPRSAIAVAPSKDRDIQISSGASAPSLATGAGSVMAAYQLLQQGRLEEARRVYEPLRALEPNNPDVLLGLGLIAQRQGRTDDAAQLFLKALDVDPKNAFAQASLSGMIARADPAAAEAKLKALIAQQPAAFLSFRLGNVYAAQGRWNEAQAAYFEAQRLETDSPDYAFNLAISLERIQQPHLALEYYQRALKLAQTKAAAFDVAVAKARIQQLSVTK